MATASDSSRQQQQQQRKIEAKPFNAIKLAQLVILALGFVAVLACWPDSRLHGCQVRLHATGQLFTLVNTIALFFICTTVLLVLRLLGVMEKYDRKWDFDLMETLYSTLAAILQLIALIWVVVTLISSRRFSAGWIVAPVILLGSLALYGGESLFRWREWRAQQAVKRSRKLRNGDRRRAADNDTDDAVRRRLVIPLEETNGGGGGGTRRASQETTATPSTTTTIRLAPQSTTIN